MLGSRRSDTADQGDHGQGVKRTQESVANETMTRGVNGE